MVSRCRPSRGPDQVTVCLQLVAEQVTVRRERLSKAAEAEDEGAVLNDCVIKVIRLRRRVSELRKSRCDEEVESQRRSQRLREQVMMVRNESDASKLSTRRLIERREGSNASRSDRNSDSRGGRHLHSRCLVCFFQFEAQSVGESSKQCSPACDPPSVTASCRRVRMTEKDLITRRCNLRKRQC